MSRDRTLHVTDGRRTVVIPADAFDWQFARSGGPGGQHVNRTSSKAVLRLDLAGTPHLPDDVRRRMLARERSRLTVEGTLVIASQVHRDQGRNVTECLARLSELVQACLTPPKRRRPTRTPRSAIAKRLDTKKKRSDTKRMRQRPDG